jgi:hypothetical protein
MKALAIAATLLWLSAGPVLAQDAPAPHAQRADVVVTAAWLTLDAPESSPYDQ